MKILICHRVGGAFGYISDSWINALEMSPGIDVARWDGKPESWSRFRPDLYMGCSGHHQPIPVKPKRAGCKVAIHVNPYGPVKVQPNINEPPKTIEWVKKQDPDGVFGYGLEKDRDYWSFWDRDGIPWSPMACAGDATLFNPHNGAHSLDVVYLGGRWDYKAKSIDPYLLPVMRDKDLTHMLHGWGKWPSDLIVRQTPDNQVPNVLSSAKVGPCISEPHSIRYGIDIPERVFKVALSGTVAVHDPVAHMSSVLKSVPVASSPSEYHDRIKSLAHSSSDLILTKARKQYNEVFGSHTYHHRLSGMLKSLGFVDEARSVMDSLKLLRVDF